MGACMPNQPQAVVPATQMSSFSSNSVFIPLNPFNLQFCSTLILEKACYTLLDKSCSILVDKTFSNCLENPQPDLLKNLQKEYLFPAKFSRFEDNALMSGKRSKKYLFQHRWG